MTLDADLLRYLQESRDRVVAHLDGLSEYDVRRPMTPTATNLLGLVKHLASMEIGYLVESVGRTGPRLPWVEDGSIWDSADMWATPEQSRAELVELYRSAWRHADAAVTELGLDAPAEVAWWPAGRRSTTLGSLVVRMVAETAQHAGQADVVREAIDGKAGGDHDGIGDARWWADHYATVQNAAATFRTPDGG